MLVFISEATLAWSFIYGKVLNYKCNLPDTRLLIFSIFVSVLINCDLKEILHFV